MFYHEPKATYIFITKMGRLSGSDEWEAFVKREYPKLSERPELMPVETREEAEKLKEEILETNPERQVYISNLN